MNNEPPNPYLPNGTSPGLQDEASVLAMLAAESGRGFDAALKPIAIPQLKIANIGDTDPDSKWRVTGAQQGDILIGAAIKGTAVEATPFYDRPLWLQRKRRSDGKGWDNGQTWGKEPPDAEYVRGKGMGYMRANGDHLLKLRKLRVIVEGRPCMLTLFDDEGVRLIEALRREIYSRRIRGTGKTPPLYATKIRIESHLVPDERNGVPIERWEWVLTLLGVYPDADGPDAATVRFGQELCAGEEMVRFPDPDIMPILRVVGSDLTPPDNEAPPVQSLNEYGEGDDLPDFLRP